jgi:hypothetical protein
LNIVLVFNAIGAALRAARRIRRAADYRFHAARANPPQE